MSAVRKHLIAAGVKNLKEFGYPDVTEANILTDRVYSAFFLSMLQDNLGKGHDQAIQQLIDEVQHER